MAFKGFQTKESKEMIRPSDIHPDVELREFLRGKIRVGLANGTSSVVTVYGDWEKPTNEVPDDFLIVMNNGDVGGVGMAVDYATGYVAVSLYCKLNDDGTVKKNRVTKILHQFDDIIERLQTASYYFRYASPQFITPTTPNITSGYSITTLNLIWHTKNNFNE